MLIPPVCAGMAMHVVVLVSVVLMAVVMVFARMRRSSIASYFMSVI
jgi:hypothetical protein